LAVNPHGGKPAWRLTRLAVNLLGGIPHGVQPAWRLITKQLTTNCNLVTLHVIVI